MMNTLLQKRHSLFQLASPNDDQRGWRYGFAFVVTGVALLLTEMLNRYVGNPAFDICQAAVVLSAWYGGFGPGVLSSGLSILALDYFFIPPIHAFELVIEDLVRLVIFGSVALLTSSLSARLKQAKAELERSHEKLEQRVDERTEELSRVNTELSQEITHRLDAEKAMLEISHREQRRLGQDLHDGLCQILAGMKLYCGELKAQLTAQSMPQAKDVGIIEIRLAEALAQADTVSRGLYPVELETNGLMSALEELTENVSKAYSVKCRFICPKPVFIIDSSIATHLYRIAQEAIMNSIKGGKAKRITVRLVARAPRILLSVTDDGIGFHHHPLRKGMGLKIMEYRARMINATLHWRSRLRGWTRVSCSFELVDIGE